MSKKSSVQSNRSSKMTSSRQHGPYIPLSRDSNRLCIRYSAYLYNSAEKSRPDKPRRVRAG
eukprot:IDg7366t1